MDDENYAWRREARNDVSTYIGQEGIGGMLRGFDMTGLSSMYQSDQHSGKRQRSIYDWLFLKLKF